MYTADHARKGDQEDLDRRIKAEVESSSGTSGYLRIYHDDWFKDTIEEELEKRGFVVGHVPDIVLKGDVYFSWEEEDE